MCVKYIFKKELQVNAFKKLNSCKAQILITLENVCLERHFCWTLYFKMQRYYMLNRI